MAASEVQTPSAAVDVVCVLNEALAQVFENARPMKAQVKEESKGMKHPLETGSTITDHRIILPVAIELSMMLATADYPTTYNQIKDLFLRGELLTVQTRVGTYPSMLIEKMPHDEGSDMQDACMLALSLEEAQFVTPQFSTFKVASPRDSNTAKRGEQQPKDSPARSGSILSGIFR